MIATEWPEFCDLDAKTFARAMRGRTIVDLRNLLDREALAGEGFVVHSIGRNARLPARRAVAQRRSARAGGAVHNTNFVNVAQGATI